MSLGVLRALQTQTDGRLSGSWSWAPYGITLVLLGGLILLTVRMIKGGRKP